MEDKTLDWPQQPSLLVNKRVEILWKNGSKYKGTVTRYYENAKVHVVLYDDNDEKHYDMFTRTFQIEGESKIWTPEESNARRDSNKPALPSTTTSSSIQTPIQHTTYGQSHNSNYSTSAGYGGASNYGGQGYGYGGVTYARQWVPFVSRTPNALTTVTFHVFLDQRALGVGDRVMLTGSLEVMGNWRQGGGIEMTPDQSNPLLWVAVVDLPLAMSDAAPYGLFQFRYEIVSARDGTIIEGQNERTENTMRRNFYHVFRSNYYFARFRGWTASNNNGVVMRHFLQYELSRLRSGMTEISRMLDIFYDIMESLGDCKRDIVEELLEDYLETMERNNAVADGNLVCIYLGMIGAFGLTSNEQVYTAGTGYTYSYVNGIPIANPGYNTVTKKLPPKPTAWCYYCAGQLDVVSLYKMNWMNHFGSRSFWISKGIAEAIERLSEHGSYDYLQIIPLTSKFHISPRIVHHTKSVSTGQNNRKKNKKVRQRALIQNQQDMENMVDEFLDVAQNIVMLANEQYHLMEKEKSVLKTSNPLYVVGANIAENNVPQEGEAQVNVATADDTAIGLESLLKVERVDMSKKCANLAKFWLHGVIDHAPSLDALKILAENDMHMLPALSYETLVEAFCNRVQNEKLMNEQLFDALQQLIMLLEPLRCPQMATAILKNETIDDFTGRLVILLETCIPGETWRLACELEQSQAVEESKSPNSDEQPQGNNDEKKVGLPSIFHEVNTAAKEWVRRKFSIEPAPPMVEEKKEVASSWGFSNWTNIYTEKKPKKLTEQEIQQQYRDFMSNALLEIEMLLSINFFQSNPNGLLFELSRCWFMKGRPQNVLDGLCFVGRNPVKSYSIYSPPLAAYLQGKVSKQVKVAVLNTADTNIQTMHTISNVFNNESPLGHQLMYEVAATVTWPYENEITNMSRVPPLQSILDNEIMWRMLSQWRRGGIAHSALISVLGYVSESILSLARNINNLSCTLRDLHIVESASDALFALLVEFNGGSLLSKLKLQQCINDLLSFDRNLEHVQTYASFFCTCGVKINATAVRNLVETLHKNYDNMLLSTVFTALSSVEALPHITWLHDLRSSELFLHHWRNVGREICMETVQDARNLLAAADINDDVEENVPLVFADGATEEEMQQQIAARAALEEDRLRNQFQLQDMRRNLIEQVESVELTQAQVISVLIPRVKHEWLALAISTFSGSISLTELDNNFGRLVTDIQIGEELRLLASSDFSSTELLNTPKQSMVYQTKSKIQDYHFFRNLRKWLPSMCKLHEYLQSLFSISLEEDSFRSNIIDANEKIKSNFNDLTLNRIPALVSDLRETFSEYTQDQLNFLSTLATSPELTAWLLQRSSTEEFNRLLQVVRPCTDEPRLLSAIASLVHIRTILLQPLYVQPPYANFKSFLDSFILVDLQPDIGSGSNALWHLNNIISSFDALMEVFEKQTRSPGIKSCYDLRDILDRGVFVLRPNSDSSKVLVLELVNKRENGSESSGQDVTIESMEYLLDLRSKLLMTEIPVELEEEMQASTMVDSFVQQLQVLSEICDLLVDLCVSGHLEYQEAYEMRLPFTLDGVPRVQKHLADFQQIADEWANEVKESRKSYYFLNFFTMREVLRLRMLLNSVASGNLLTVSSSKIQVEKSDSTNDNTPISIPEDIDDFLDPDVLQMEQMGFPREWAEVALNNTNHNIENAIEFCLSNSQMMERLVAEHQSRREHGTNASGTGTFDAGLNEMDKIFDETPVDLMSEILGLLHLVSSDVKFEVVAMMVDLWKEKMSLNQPLLVMLGSILSVLFGKNKEECAAKLVTRSLTPLGERVANKADMLVLLDDASEKRLPVFVYCTESPLLVIDTVLSVYVRRGRIPEPGEIIFCTAETTAEDLNLILLRFINAKNHGRSGHVFCVADLHNLSYTQQCTLVEKLRNLFVDYGSENASTLLLVSGVPRQVALNALSSHAVDLPPLESQVLRKSCHEAFSEHCGETACVASEINGGGKSHYIMNLISNRQESDPSLIYSKVPIREGTTSQQLVKMLSGHTYRVAFHLDIAHIIPAAANTMLFQLLLVGVLRDPITNRVYFRNPDDIFMLEVPNSPKNKTIAALRFCNLLPYTILQVSQSTLKFMRPELSEKYITDRNGIGKYITAIQMVEYFELKYVCKWLRAVRDGVLQHRGPNYQADFTPWTDDNITEAECFTLLCNVCSKPDGPSPMPSWSIFHSFIVFMNMQFSSLEKYALFQGEILTYIQGLENFKSVFIGLLINTSTDFSLRSVPQISFVGPHAGAKSLADEFADFSADNLDDALPMMPTLHRDVSSDLRRAEQEVGVLNPPALVRQTSEELANRFRNMISWEQSDHPIVVFKMDGIYGDVSGVDILSLQREFVDQYIHGDLKASLEQNSIRFNRDWSKISNEEGVSILRQIDGLGFESRGGVESLEPGYVMTVDNMLKMLSIQLRLRFNLPVVIMGETGAGKSTLIRNMCGILGSPLHILNIHGGMEDADIISWMQQKIIIANRMRDPSERVIVLLDEINTCNSMGLFKELVCDRTLNGKPLPNKIKIIAACNPYRLRKTKSLYGGEEMAGLVFEHFCAPSNLENVGTGIKDPLRNLVYRVHPLPESMIDHIFDFGSLSSETESLYIKAMLRKQLEVYNEDDRNFDDAIADDDLPTPVRRYAHNNVVANMSTMSPFKEFVEVFSELICEAQECVRQLADGERSYASLRDVARCIKVFIWFGEHFANTKGVNEGWSLVDFFSFKNSALNYIRKAVILSLAYCYHARLPRQERRTLIDSITNKWRSFQVVNNPVGGVGGGLYGGYGYGGIYGALSGAANNNYWANYYRAKCRWLNLDRSAFLDALGETQHEFVSVMNLGEGIALNEALCENLFMILVSVLNQIPVFVIGKPGSSKSLAMGLVQSNLNGDASENAFLRSLPAVEVFSYQCSPLSTSAGIEQAFESSRRYKREATNTVVVVLLDEVGLAEQSPHLPLKVLHKMLDEAGGREAVVGISNWALDPAKMNRAVHLYRPAPTVDDLSLTAEGMVRSANLKGYLRGLAQAYNEIYLNQEHPDFWGLREFYSTVRAINTSLNTKRKETGFESVALDSNMLLNAILRNFGGRPHEMETVISKFFNLLGLPIPPMWKEIPVESLIKVNLNEPDARHIMLLTKNNAALSLLLDRNLLKQDNTEIIFGSDFLLDQTDLQIYVNIQKIKLCMAEGITVVLVHCESLYESLYDLLNQHYVEYGGQTYVRLAFGTYTRLCVIHRNFRVVVVVEKDEAYTRLAPPLLNRFEKQVFERSNVLVQEQRHLLARLHRFAVAFATAAKKSSQSMEVTLSTMRSAFCGYHSDMLSSLILATESCVPTTDEETMNMSEVAAQNVRQDALFKECVNRLLWIATPESTCRLMTTDKGQQLAELYKEYNIDCPRIYFQQQCHSSLPAFADRMLEEWKDELGSQLVLMTHSPLTHDAAVFIREKGYAVTHVVLHELDQERELRQSVSEFFRKAEAGSTLLVQCDPLATSRRRLEHSKFMIELIRAKHLKKIADNSNAVAQDHSSAVNESKGEEDEPVALDRVAIDFTSEKEDLKSKEKGKGVHVILLLHLPRGETSNESTYSIDFDTRWRTAFVDSVSSADINGLPTAEAMIGKSIIEVFKELDTKKVLLKTFRSSLSKLVCLYDRTNNDVRKQIMNITHCFDNKDFIETMKESLEKLMQYKYGAIDIDITHAALKERELQLAGSFQGALHKQILDAVSSMFAVVLSHMDRNHTLSLFAEDRSSPSSDSSALSSFQLIWLYLFRQSFNVISLVSQMKKKSDRKANRSSGQHIVRNEDIVEVKNDSFGGIGTFYCKFPFSFFIIPIVDTMRRAGEMATGLGGEIQFTRQVSTLCLEYNLSDDISDDFVYSYCYDIVSSKCKHVSNMSRDEQTRVVLHILSQVKDNPISHNHIASLPLTDNSVTNETKGDDDFVAPISTPNSSPMKGPSSTTPSSAASSNAKITSIAQIHYRFWKVERLLELYFDLMDSNSSSINDITQYLMALNDIDSTAHSGLLNIILTNIYPSEFCKSYDTPELYRNWFSKLSLVRPSFFALWDLIENPDLKRSLHLKWLQLEFFQTYIRDVVIPIELPVSNIKQFIELFQDESQSLASHVSLKNVIYSLNLIYKTLSDSGDIPDEYLCSITLERLIDPVVAADGYTYERSAIQEWFDLNRTLSPRTNEPLADFILRPNTYLRDKLSGEYMMSDLRRFLEYYIFDVLLSPNFKYTLTFDVIQDLIDLASGCSIHNLTSSSELTLVSGLESILPSGKSLSIILSELFKISANESLDTVMSYLESKLNEIVQSKGYLDTPLSIAYVNVTQESETITDVNEIDLTALSKDYNQTRSILDTVSKIRSILCKFGDMICECFDDEKQNIDKYNLLEMFSNSLSPMLEDTTAHTFTKSMRIFLMKRIERQRGISFLRNVFIQNVFTQSKWLQQWKLSDIGFSRFMGSNKLPHLNPFVSVPLFSDVQSIITKYLKSGNVAILDSLMEPLLQSNSTNQIKFTLLVVCFNEIALLSLLPSDATEAIKSLCPGLAQWINSSPVLNFITAIERKMIIYFGLGKFGNCNFNNNNNYELMFLDENSSSESVMKMRFVVHVVASALRASNTNHPFHFLHTILFQPQLCQDSYFPGMPEDITKMAQNVLGGRWYACPNNHPFYVDLCGRPTRIQVCATCGAQIGGENHNLIEGNIDLGGVGTALYQTTNLQDNSEKNYCFRTAQQEFEDKFFSARRMSPPVARVIRVILHSAMVGGSCLGGTVWDSNAQCVFNRAYCQPTNVIQFLMEHLTCDWLSLRSLLARTADDVDLILHMILHRVNSVEIQPIDSTVGNGFKTLQTLESRAMWENQIGIECSAPLISTDEKTLTDALAVATKTFSNSVDDQSSGLFATELLEKYSIDSLSTIDRKINAPGLWRFTKTFSYDDFIVSLNLLPKAADKFPVLWSFVTQDSKQIYSLRYLPQVFEWFRLLTLQYSGHIDRETARSESVGYIISQIEDPVIRRKWETAFEGFSAAWNGSWGNVQKYGCIQFSSDFNNLVSDSSIPVSFSLPNEIDEGNCPLALAHYLIDKHNNIAQLVDEAKLLRMRQTSKSSSSGGDINRLQVISSRFLTVANTIRCDIMNDFVPLIEKHCMIVSSVTGKTTYDYLKAENILIDRFLADVCAIDLEMPGFTFSHEQHLHGGLASLRQKLKQKVLSNDIIRAIKREITTPVQAQHILEILETVVSFLSATGGSLVQTLNDTIGDMLLSKYISTVLLMDDDINSRVITQQVYLKNLESLWDVLTEITSCDIFAKVHSDYRKPVRSSVKNDLLRAMSMTTFNTSKLLSAMKSFIVEYLQEKHISPTESVFTCLGNVEVDENFLADIAWFSEYFPKSVELREIVEAYHFIVESQQTMENPINSIDIKN